MKSQSHVLGSIKVNMVQYLRSGEVYYYEYPKKNHVEKGLGKTATKHIKEMMHSILVCYNRC